MQNNYQAIDPVLNRLHFSTIPYDWEVLVDPDNKKENEFMDAAEKAGLTSGIVCTVRTRRDEFYALSMCGRKSQSTLTEKVWIKGLCTIFHMFRSQLSHYALACDDLVLTGKQKSYLEMVAEGFSIGAIASSNGVSESAVKKRLGEAYRRLGVNNGHFAVAKAIAYGIIAPKIIRPWLQEDR